MQTEQNSPDHLHFLESLLNDRRMQQLKIESEYQEIKDKLDEVQEEYKLLLQEYQQMGGEYLCYLQDRRDDLAKKIRERDNQVKKLSEELDRLKIELANYRNEIECIRKDIAILLRRTKSHRDRLGNLSEQIKLLSDQKGKLSNRNREAQLAIDQYEKQYLVALQWEKSKPLIFSLGLLVMFIIILFAFVFAANQLSLYGLVPVVLVTCLVFFVIVIVILRQDEKLKEENFVQLMRDVIKGLNLLKK